MGGWIGNEKAVCGNSSGLGVESKDLECEEFFSVAREIRAPKILRICFPLGQP